MRWCCSAMLARFRKCEKARATGSTSSTGIAPELRGQRRRSRCCSPARPPLARARNAPPGRSSAPLPARASLARAARRAAGHRLAGACGDRWRTDTACSVSRRDDREYACAPWPLARPSRSGRGAAPGRDRAPRPRTRRDHALCAGQADAARHGGRGLSRAAATATCRWRRRARRSPSSSTASASRPSCCGTGSARAIGIPCRSATRGGPSATSALTPRLRRPARSSRPHGLLGRRPPHGHRRHPLRPRRQPDAADPLDRAELPARLRHPRLSRDHLVRELTPQGLARHAARRPTAAPRHRWPTSRTSGR